MSNVSYSPRAFARYTANDCFPHRFVASRLPFNNNKARDFDFVHSHIIQYQQNRCIEQSGSCSISADYYNRNKTLQREETYFLSSQHNVIVIKLSCTYLRCEPDRFSTRCINSSLRPSRSSTSLLSVCRHNSSTSPRCNYTSQVVSAIQEFQNNQSIITTFPLGRSLTFSVKFRQSNSIPARHCPSYFAARASLAPGVAQTCQILVLGTMGSSITVYGVAAMALGGVIVVSLSAVLIVAIAIVFQPRWLLKIVRKQMPHIVFDHVTMDPMVALTIDDGPNGETTHQLLDILSESDAKATFFLIGQNIDKYPELRDRMYAEGHELGNHTMEDVPSWRLPPDEFERALLEVDARLHGFFYLDENGRSMKWFRPGHGWYTKQIRRIVQQHGYQLALGSVYPVDPLFKEKGGPIASYCLWKIYPGAVIVLHDRPQQLNQTIEVLSRMLPELKRRGYQVVTLSQLLKGKDNVSKRSPLIAKL